MQIFTMCSACLAEMTEDERNEHFMLPPLTDRVVQVVECDRGHKFAVALRQPTFVLMYERALYRLANESVRDAVIDANTALEIYYSHVPVRARYDRVEKASPRAIRDEVGSIIGSAEKARTAAETTAFLLNGIHMKRPKIANLRDNAVHAGRYPSEAEAEGAIVAVADTIRAFEDALATQKSVGTQPYWDTDFAEKRAEGILALAPAVMTPSIVSVNAALDSVLERQPHDVVPRVADYRTGRWAVVK